jgi:hypothetical protein
MFNRNNYRTLTNYDDKDIKIKENYTSAPSTLCFPEINGKSNPLNNCTTRESKALCTNTKFNSKTNRVKHCGCNAQNICIRPDGI